MKHCPRCNQDKELSHFYKDNGRPGGTTIYCKPCHREVSEKKEQTEFFDVDAYAKEEMFQPSLARAGSDWGNRGVVHIPTFKVKVQRRA